MKVRKRQLIDRILASVLALLMIITMLPQTAFVSKAARDVSVYVYSGNHVATNEVQVNLSTNGGYSVSGTTNGQGRVTISIDQAHQNDNFTATVLSDDYDVVSTNWSDLYYVEIVVKRKQSNIQFEQSELSIKCGATAKNIAKSVGGSDGATVRGYSSDNTSIATVDNSGTAKGIAVGSTTIWAIGNNNKKLASYTITVTKGDQGPIKFQKANPGSIDYGTTNFKNVASKVQGYTNYVSNVINYKSSDESVVTVNESGVLTTLKAGENVKITATIPGGDNYEDTSAFYTITVNRISQDNAFEFEKEGNHEITYGETFTNVASGGNTGKISYSFQSETSDIVSISNGVVTPNKAGTVEIIATSEQDDYYLPKSISYQLLIHKASQSITLQHGTEDIPALAYGATYSNPVKNPLTAISYASDDESIATVDENGVVTGLNPGTTTIRVSAAEDDCYLSAETSYEIEVIKATQTLSFEKGKTPSVTFNDNGNVFLNEAESNADFAQEQDLVISYEIVEQSREGILKEDFENKAGQFVVQGAGTVKVRATVNENDHYLGASEEYVLTINKAEQEIKFPQDSYEQILGIDDEYEGLQATEIGNHSTSGKITYRIAEDSNNALSSLNEETGGFKVNLSAGSDSNGVVGRVKIEAVKEGDDNYNSSATESYTLIIKYRISEDTKDGYTISGAKGNSGWYLGEVKITPNAGTVLLEIQRGGYTRVDEITLNSEGRNRKTFFLVRPGRGFAQETVNVNIDSQNPSITSIRAGGKNLLDDTDPIAFYKSNGGSNDALNFTLSATDPTPGSGLEKYKYYIGMPGELITTLPILDADVKKITSWTSQTSNSFSVEANKRFFVAATASDKAGNAAKVVSTKEVVYDTLVPTADLTVVNTIHGEHYTDAAITVNVKAADNLAGIKKIEYEIKNNGSKTDGGVLYDFFTETEIALADLKYDDLKMNVERNIEVVAAENDSDNVIVYVTVEDFSGNKETYQKELRIMAHDPQMTVTVSNEEGYRNKLGDVEYFDVTRTATIEIRDRNTTFATFQENFVLNVTENKGSEEDGQTYTVGNWETELPASGGDAIHRLTITFNGSGQYSFNVSYVNKADRSAEPYQSKTFVVDKKAPTGTLAAKGSKLDKTWAELVSPRYFTIWKNSNVTVTANAADNVSPLKSKKYYVTDGKTALSVSELNNIPEEEWTDYGNALTFSENKIATVYFRVIDYAEHVTYLSTDGIIVDKAAPGITLEYDAANNFEYYNKDLGVKITVQEPRPYSGIRKVEYWVEKDTTDALAGTKTQSGVLYDFEKATAENVTYDDLEEIITNTISIDAKKNDSDNVRLYVKATDNAGNVIYYAGEGTLTDSTGRHYLPLKFSTKAPKVEVWYDIKNPNATADDGGVERAYFGKTLTATIYVTERASVLYKENMLSGVDETGADSGATGIVVKGKNAKGEELTLSAGDVRTTYEGSILGETQDESIHTFKVVFNADANYDFTLSYVNKAGNKCEYGDVTFYGGSRGNEEDWKSARKGKDADRYFTVDKTNPTATVTVDGFTWDGTQDERTFGLWSKKNADVSATAQDVTSPVRIQYYKTDKTDVLKKDDLDKVTDWQDYNAFTAKPEDRFTIYLKVSDYAGNYIYVSSEGFILDTKAVADENFVIALPDPVTVVDGMYAYNGDVKVGLKVSEFDVNTKPEDIPAAMLANYYSGIQKVEYWIVTNEGKTTESGTSYAKETQREVLFRFDYVRNGVTKDEEGNVTKKDANSQGGMLTITSVDKDGNRLPVETYGTEGDEAYPLYEQLRHTFETTITVDSGLNNCSDVTLHVGVTDNAGNYVEKTAKMDIDVTAPKISVTYKNEKLEDKPLYDEKLPFKTVDDRGYFPVNRTATIVITERANHFDAKTASENIKIKAVNSKGEEVELDLAGMLDEQKWTTSQKKTSDGVPTPDADTHTLVIRYEVDGNYDFEIQYADVTKNGNEGVTAAANETPYHFTIDKVAPTGEITADVDSTKEGGRYKHTWTELIKTLTFGIWSDKGIAITADSKDETSPMEDLTYYLTDAELALTEEELLKLVNDDAAKDDATKKNWKKFEEFELEPNMQGTVYLCIIDYAGNVTFISTNAMILDNTHADVPALAPSISVSAGATGGIFNGDVPITVSVTDPKNGGAFSGLKEVRYSVSNMGNTTQEGTLYSTEFSAKNGIDNATAEDPEKTSKLLTYEELLKTQGYRGGFTVSSKNNNSNDVRINVYAEDNAGNTYSRSETIKIDVSEPVIRVTYDNNDGDVTFADGMTDAYFNNVRTATINIAERNFEASRVTVNIINSDGVIPALSGWTTIPGPGNGDGTQHVATIVYAADGDYQFEITCSDMATNKDKGTDYASSLAPQKFTIDRTVPVINVTYDNNSAQNGNYYKDMRTATVTIDEHNFETSRIRVMMTANNDGNAVPLPAVSNWTNNGDRHVALITFRDDAQYTLDVDYEDKARNASADMEMQRFYVDTVLPELKIEGIVDESANNTSGNIGFVMTATDVNFDVFEPKLTATYRNGNDFETKELTIGDYTDVKNGRVLTITNLESDGMYRIECRLVDKAGNAYDQVILTKKDGSEYAEHRAEGSTLVTFSVNRQGSTYEVDAKTQAVLDKYYLRKIDDNIVLHETNVDPLKEFKVTLNGRELEKDKDYFVEESSGKGKWHRYTYSISKALFEGEGEYVIVSSSKDKADNDAFNDVKGASIQFVVDRTPPVVTVTGLANSGRYQTENQRVTIVPTDDGGALKSLTVSLVDNSGKVIRELLNLQEEALATALEQGGGTLSFDVPEGLYQNVKIVAEDQAGSDEEDANTFDETIKNVSVASSGILIFWANKPLRWSVIGGGVGFLALLIFLIMRKKKKEQKR